MEKTFFTNSNSILREKTLEILVPTNRQYIESIAYYKPNGVFIEEYNQCPIATDNIHFISDESIINAGYLLCRFDPQKFYELYKTVLSAKTKELLNISIEKLVKEYSLINLQGKNESDFQKPTFTNIWSGRYFFNTKENSLNTLERDIVLDENNKLIQCISQYRNYCTKVYGDIYTYQKPQNSTKCSAEHEVELTEEVVKKFARFICQSDVNVYLELLNTINSTDPYYQAVVNGGTSFIDDIKILTLKL